MTADELATALGAQAGNELASALAKIKHCLSQLPADANHHGTLYAGTLLRLALEAGYATAWKHVGTQANLVLRRVLNLECLRPVPVGTVIEINGAVLHRTRAHLVTGLLGTPLKA